MKDYLQGPCDYLVRVISPLFLIRFYFCAGLHPSPTHICKSGTLVAWSTEVLALFEQLRPFTFPHSGASHLFSFLSKSQYPSIPGKKSLFQEAF